jgi:methylmalonyl-CoA mutase
VIAACKVAGFDLVVVETSGIGQGDAAIVPLVDVSLYVMTPEFGAASQLEKIDMLDFADFVAINKFDRKGAEDALRDVRKQYQRNRELFGDPPDDMPVFGTMAARFNDDGVTALYQALAPRWWRRASSLARPRQMPLVASRPPPAGAPSCRPSACATWPRSPIRCAATTSTSRAGHAGPRAPVAASAKAIFEGCKQEAAISTN